MARIAKMVLIQILCLLFPMFALAGQIPDTGQTKCYDNSGEIPCPKPGKDFYGQDAQYAGPARSYTKLGQNGVELPDTATQAEGWIMTRDNVTGLIWEIKTDDGSIHDKDDTYTWYGAQDVFIQELNQQSFGGYSDWRLPTVKDLSSLVNSVMAHPGPTINIAWFPRMIAPSAYWSSTTYAGYTDDAWFVYFGDGQVSNGYKPTTFYVRAVRGSHLINNLTDNGDGTVTDTETGLMWQKATAPGTYTWQEALAYAEGLELPVGGYSDWRIPNRNELQTLVDYTQYDPAYDPLLQPLPMSPTYWYWWSSTTYADNTDNAWLVGSYSGNVYYGSGKSNSHYVRAVRGGQTNPAPPAKLALPWIPLLLLQDDQPISGQPKDTLKIGETYSIRTEYKINDATTFCFLKIAHPDTPLSLAYDITQNEVVAGWRNEDCISPVSVTEISRNSKTIVLEWNFFLKSAWPLTDSGVHFEISTEYTNPTAWISDNLSLAYELPDYGTTIITHGYQLPIPGTVPDWTETMARAIGNRLGNAMIMRLETDSGIFRFVDSVWPIVNSSECEYILITDWATESDQIAIRGYSEAAADALVAALIRYQHQITNENPGDDVHFLDKLHFIGHSRGCVVTSEMIERIIELRDVSVFANGRIGDEISVTYLDPHPIWHDQIVSGGVDADKVNPCISKSDQVVAWNGVTYADNYYQSISLDPHLSNPDGMAVLSAYNRDLDTGNGHIGDGYTIDHSDVHAWYHGTIDPEAEDDGPRVIIPPININREDWYSDDLGIVEGFAHSPHGGRVKHRTAVLASIPKPSIYYDYQYDSVFNGTFQYGGGSPGWHLQGGMVWIDFVEDEHLKLHGNNMETIHNWLYIPSNASTLNFNYKIQNGENGTPPDVDKLQVFIGDTKVLDNIYLSIADEGDFYINRSVPLADFRNTVNRITFKIVQGGLSLNTEVHIDDISIFVE